MPLLNGALSADRAMRRQNTAGHQREVLSPFHSSSRVQDFAAGFPRARSAALLGLVALGYNSAAALRLPSSLPGSTHQGDAMMHHGPHFITSCLFALSLTSKLTITTLAADAPTTQPAGHPERTTPAALLDQYDKNKDGFLDKSEIPEWLNRPFERIDTNRDAKLSRAELDAVADRLAQAQRRPAGAVATRPANRPDAAARQGPANEPPGVVVTPPARDERIPDRLKAGDVAPEFKLPDPSGTTEIALADLHRTKPVVLVFCSYTCPPFRRMSVDVEKMHQEYRDRAAFLLVYIREAHPDSLLPVRKGEGPNVMQKIRQTSDLKSRSEHAEICRSMLTMTFPFVVDREDNKVDNAYAGWPIRMAVVDVDGKIGYIGGPGPGGFKVPEVREWLEKHTKVKDTK
jgi:hypothetical protein